MKPIERDIIANKASYPHFDQFDKRKVLQINLLLLLLYTFLRVKNETIIYFASTSHLYNCVVMNILHSD